METENAAERHTTGDEEETVVAMNWQSGDSDNNGSDNSRFHENPEDELRHLLHKSGARKGSDERDLNYISEEEVWQCHSSFTIVIIIACGTLNLLIQFVGSQS
jgi:hypothetical protein